MNKKFAHKFVNWQIQKMYDEVKDSLTFGDVSDVADRVARDELSLAHVSDELRWLADCNRTIKALS